MKDFNPVKLQVYRSLLEAMTEEMGTVLKRTAFSPNIKERLDFSCALFNKDAEMIIQAAHIPVHLGSMPLAVKEILNKIDLNTGDIIITNDPYSGGTHLPDITVVKKVNLDDEVFYIANRAHHSDVGGMAPGSMPLSNDIFQEGLIIPPLKLYENNYRTQIFDFILQNVRTPEEREGDLQAQVNALNVGEKRLRELSKRYDAKEISYYSDVLIDYSSDFTKSLLKTIPDGTYKAVDYLDDDGAGTKNVKIEVTLTVKNNKCSIDFTGTSKNVEGCINAPLPITNSAVLYVLRTLIKGNVAANSGILKPVDIIAPQGSLVNPEHPHAVAGGNVETSQRIVDVLYLALSKAVPDLVPAASQGTMNNLTLGSSKHSFAYYETIPGGMGARPGSGGLSAIHTHMTNTLNTPVEALETQYALEAVEYAVRNNSGGNGLYKGGNGIIRKVKALIKMNGTILSERRINPPYGLNNGGNGKKGENYIIKKSGERNDLTPKCNFILEEGDIIAIETPGGGGWGSPK